MMGKKATLFLMITITTTALMVLLSHQLNWISLTKRPIIEAIDLMPILPNEITWKMMKRSNRAVDLLPKYVGSALSSAKNYLQWRGACFHDNAAWIQFDNHTQFGGGTLHMKVNRAHSGTCMDIYIFATPYRIAWDYYFRAGEHTLDFKQWQGKAEYEYVKKHGVSIFFLQAGLFRTLLSLWEIFPLFTDTNWGEEANLRFLEKNMGASFEERPQPWVTNIVADEINSGDFLAISKVRGRWGAFETLEKWVTGSYAGHSAVCLRDPDGKLWVAESGHEDKGKDKVALVEWEKWWEFEKTEDNSNPHIALLRLHPDLRAKFNERAAWEYAQSMDGRPYGYHNLIFSWIDTVSYNYPPPLDAHLVASAMTIWNQMTPNYAADLWKESLNKRLGTEGLDMPEILVEVENRGSTFAELLAIPEQDDWEYTDGKSVSCVAFVVEIYKAAGLFGSLSSSIQATEFTIKDAYTLKFYENNSSRLPSWCNDGDNVELPYCQIKGKYRMELPGYNTIDPYPHMNENCPSLPPDYYRPKTC